MQFRAVVCVLAFTLGCHGASDEPATDAGEPASEASAVDASGPQPFAPKIFVIDAATGDLVAPTAAVTAEAPMSVHVSAIPEITDHPCTWDPTAWRAAGQHDLCDLDRADFAVSTTLGSDVSAFFGSGVATPVNAEAGTPQLCLLLPPNGAAYDPTTAALIHAVSNCVRDRDVAFATQVSHELLGDSNLATTQFAWDFGDPGSPFDRVRGINAAHVFSAPGAYTVTLTVTTETGEVATATMSVTATASTRTEVDVRTQADFDALYASASGSGRWIRLLRGATFHVTKTGPIQLGTGDWLTSFSETAGVPDATPTGALPLLVTDAASEVFAFEQGSHDVVLEQVQIAGGTARAQVAGVHNTNNVVIRDLPFQKIGKGFDIGGNGILIENTGTPPDASGTWVSDDLTSNFAISTARALTFYGNHFFVAAASGDGEPGVRSNGGELLAFVGNDLGGSIGKLDSLSLRGTKHAYIGFNRIRGGVDNIQWGTSQDPQPAVVPFDIAFEGNQLDNNTVAVGEAVRDVSIRNNIMRLHKLTTPTNKSADPYFAQFPYESNYLIELNGAGMTGLLPEDVFVANNTLSFEEDDTALGGAPFVLNASTNVVLVNNVFSSPAIAPFHFWDGAAPMAGLARVEGNAFFVGANVKIAPTGAAGIAAWNAQPLGTGATVADQAFALAQTPVVPAAADADDLAGVTPAAASPIAATGVPLAGAYGVTADVTGAPRPATGGWTPGAVQAP